LLYPKSLYLPDQSETRQTSLAEFRERPQVGLGGARGIKAIAEDQVAGSAGAQNQASAIYHRLTLESLA
jgi:hypothetical protein